MADLREQGHALVSSNGIESFPEFVVASRNLKGEGRRQHAVDRPRRRCTAEHRIPNHEMGSLLSGMLCESRESRVAILDSARPCSTRAGRR